ncbi:hypothetical protein Nepgr_017705 [Nepenthes gracilis]|uniref:Bromo domain-containing protein n=1 Tax=Nepenthes gracilis TaxID=150966 RepID=A0AAD3SS51_NEPGR|nr:hypothetical protein Nepgr_017705 [Nepenthes gracilis]
MVVMVEEDVKRWGTWEELILGGAVVRHGTDDWDAVASELQSRTLYAFLFTPQVCQAKYEELQHRYSGSTAWFEELRKRRVAELKRALEKSEDSIGSLELKLEWLKAQKGVCNSVDYSSSHTESPLQAFPKSEGIEFSGKYTSKENLSAGSFTQETNTNWSPQCSAPVDMLAEPAETELVSHSSERTCLPSTDQLAGAIYTEHGLIIRKKRGKRMRKGCSMDAKEGSVGENYLLGSAKVGLTNLNCKENLTSDRGDTARSLDENDCKQCTSKEEVNDLMGILDSFMQNELVNMFRQRLDNQKRAQYKRIIRQHMDLDMIRSRVSRGSITSTRELFRDLLLLANNALVFYSKSTQEHRCAAILRDLVSSRLRRPYMAATSRSPPQ